MIVVGCLVVVVVGSIAEIEFQRHSNNSNAEVDDDDGGEEKKDGWATAVGGLGRENTTSQSIAAPRICT